MTAATQQIHLWWRPPPAGRAEAAKPVEVATKRAASTLPVPPGCGWLAVAPGETPAITREQPARPRPAVAIETIQSPRRQPRLILVTPPGLRTRVNGQAAPRFAVLKEKDHFQLPGTPVFHVMVFNQPPVGPAPVEAIGRECPVCRAPFAAGSVCYRCACGALMHCEDDSSEESLQCAKVRASSGCAACGRPLVLSAGYTYVPEAGDEE
jgi:hypothetical protein